MKKDDRKIIIIVCIVSLVCIGIVLFFNMKKNVEKLSYIRDYGEFFVVSGEVDNYLSYLSSKNEKSLFSILSIDFINKNQVNSNNVFDVLGEYSINSSFTSNGIERVEIGKNYLYLVSGSIIENGIEDTKVIDSNFRILVLHDNANNNYSIYPVFDDSYKTIINGIKKISVDSNLYNSIAKPDTFNETDVCKLYFSDYTDKLFNNIEEAYSLLDKETIQKYSSLDEFKNFIDRNKNRITSLSKLCGSKENKEDRIYVVVDKNENVYSFQEEAVMMYKVNINFNEINN